MKTSLFYGIRPLAASLLLIVGLAVSGFSQTGDWYNLDYSTDSVAGVSVNRALEYIKGKAPLMPVIVAVIDDGVDIAHPDFEGRIWRNPSEVPADGKDNENNGYIDDVHGWNFLGNPDGENIEFENLELTRLLREGAPRFDGKAEGDFQGKEKKAFKEYQMMKAQYDAEVAETAQQFEQFSQLVALYTGAMAFAQEKLGTEEIIVNQLFEFETEDINERHVFDFLIMAEAQGLRGYLDEGAKHFEAALKYHYNFDYNPRSLVNEGQGIAYGNNMVWAANPDHGTHVAGIIGAIRGNGIGVDGIAPNAIIMPVRAVPGGDERDEDVAKAIRYAVDNGAKVINMSFGKAFSPNQPVVKEAILYARSKDVLMIHAAGNDASDNDRYPNYPDGTLGKSKALDNWITVGASGPEPGSGLLADFSNYGRKKVDILAPGVDIESLEPGDGTAVNSGTSMAAPVVSGVAVLIRGLDPSLSAKEVKDILIRTAQPFPGSAMEIEGKELQLKKLVRNPAVVSAEAAVKYTLERKK